MPHALIFLLGLSSAVVLRIVGRTGIARNAVKTVIKGGILVSRQFQELAAEVTEDLQDVTAEASAEVDELTSEGEEERPGRRRGRTKERGGRSKEN
jgi:hypothetical protein